MADPQPEAEIFRPAAGADAEAIRHLIEAAHHAHADQITETDSPAKTEGPSVISENTSPEAPPADNMAAPEAAPTASVNPPAAEVQALPEPATLPLPVSESKMQVPLAGALYEARARAVFEAAELKAEPAQGAILTETPARRTVVLETEPTEDEDRMNEAAAISWAPEDLDFLKTLLPDNAEPVDEEAPLQETSHPDYVDEMFLTEGETETPAEEQDLALILQSLEPEQAEAVQPMLRSIRQIAEDIQQLPEADEIEKPVMEQTLQQWCERLLEQLDMDSDDETVRRFMSILLNQEASDAPESPDELLSADELNKRGTREYKPFDGLGALGKLAQGIKQKLHLPLWLGRYTVRAAA